MNLSTHKKSEVELRVAQELKNNKDFIYQTNQAIQKINDNLVALSLSLDRVRAEADSRVKSMFTYYENFREILEEKMENYDQRIGDVESSIFAFRLYIGKLEDKIESACVKKEAYESDKLRFDSDVKQLYSMADLQRLSLSHQVENIRGHIKNNVQDLRKEMPDMPDISPLTKKIDETLACFKVDFDGVLKELQMVKKSVAYGEKKFENIYTLIERLKADK